MVLLQMNSIPFLVFVYMVYIPPVCESFVGIFLFSFLIDILSDIIYSESNGFTQLMVIAEGDNVRYDWMVNSHLQMSSSSGILTIPSLPLGMSRIAVNISNMIGFDSKAMLILIENGATDSTVSEPSDAPSDQPGTNEKD